MMRKLALWRSALVFLFIVMAAQVTEAQNGDCDSTCPVPCMFGQCPSIDASPNPTSARDGCSENRAQNLWADAKAANDCIAYESFLAACPNTPEARFAEGRMRRLSCDSGLRPAVVRPSATPERPLIEEILFLIPGGAGGGWDATARGAGSALSSSGLAGSVSYENMSGGGGGKAIAYLIDTAPRQQSTLLVNSTPLVVRSLTRVFPQSFRDLTPVAGIIAEYGALVTIAGNGVESLSDLVSAHNPGSSGAKIGGESVPGGMDHLLAATVVKGAGADPTKLEYVPYDSYRKAEAGLRSGAIQALATDASEAADMAKRGFRVLCLTSDSRPPEFPDYPTCGELGAAAEFANWRGFFAAPGLSEAKKAEFVRTLEEMYGTPEWEVVRARNGWSEAFIPGARFEAFLAVQERRIGALMRELGFL